MDMQGVPINNVGLLDLLGVSTCGQKRHTRYQVKRENCLSEQHNHDQIKWSTAAKGWTMQSQMPEKPLKEHVNDSS